MAERIGWPPNVVRVLFALISVLSSAFPGTLFYLLLWAFVPEAEPDVEGGIDEDDADEVDLEASHLSRTAALGLAVLLGGLGAHRFYAGRIPTGLLMLLTLGGLGFWWIVDVVMVASGEFRDSEGRRLVYWEGADPEYDALYDTHLELLRASARGVDSSHEPAPERDEEGTWAASQPSTSGPVGSSSSMIPTTSHPARSSSSC